MSPALTGKVKPSSEISTGASSFSVPLNSNTMRGSRLNSVSIDTEFSRDPRIVLEFKGTEKLEAPVEISLEGFTFPVSAGDMMRERLEAERQ